MHNFHSSSQFTDKQETLKRVHLVNANPQEVILWDRKFYKDKAFFLSFLEMMLSNPV